MPTRYIDLRKLLYMDFLIRMHNTGNANQFAEKLGVSRSTFFEYKALLKYEFEAEIKFMPNTHTYIYTKTPKSKSILDFANDETIAKFKMLLEGK